MGTLSDFTNQLDSTSSKRELTCVRYCCQPRVVGWSSASGQYLLPSSTCLLLWVSSQRDVLESVPPLCCSCPASWLLLLILFYPPFTGCLGLTLLPKGLNALAFLPFVLFSFDFLFPWMLKTLLLFFHPSEILGHGAKATGVTLPHLGHLTKTKQGQAQLSCFPSSRSQ